MLPDRVRGLKNALKITLGNVAVVEDRGLDKKVPWGPHIYIPSLRQAWHLLPSAPDSSAWADRMRIAVQEIRKLRLGVAAPLEVLRDPAVLTVLAELECEILPVQELAGSYRSLGLRASICDVIYEHRIILEHATACTLLERCLSRALNCRDSYEKGASLELLTALMLSQVRGFEVTELNISSRNQEVDVHVTNRNSGGPLGRGAYVLAEAKNWKAPVPRKEYDSFAKKMRTRRGMAKLGILLTTGTFEEGVRLEAVRDSEYDDLVVLLDGTTLPRLWRDHLDMTQGLEAAITRAVYDHQ